MKLMTGDMMSVFGQVDHFLICVGSNVKAATGELTMLDGLAGVLAKQHPGLPAQIGAWVKEQGCDGGIFGLKCTSKLGLFQHTIVLRDRPALGVISMSAKMLKAVAELNPDKTYALEAPNYNDPWFLVEGIMQTLPDNVQVWKPE